MNVQFAVKEEDGKQLVYVLEVNPRASRTVPFVAKATGVAVAKLAAKVMAGMTLAELGVTQEPVPKHISVKESVFPFRKFAGVDIVLGPEMRSTGEVMGISEQFPIAFSRRAKLQRGCSCPIRVMFSSAFLLGIASLFLLWPANCMKWGTGCWQPVVQRPKYRKLGFLLYGLKSLPKGNPNLIDYLKNDDVSLIINTPSGKGARTDEGRIRAAAVQFGVPCITTMAAAEAAVKAMDAMRTESMTVLSLQERFGQG